MKITKFLFLSLFCFSFYTTNAQETNHVLGDFLIKVKDYESALRLKEKHQQFDGQETSLEITKTASKPFNIYLFHFNHDLIEAPAFMKTLRAESLVEEIQYNHYIQERNTTPNDPLFTSQWQYINDGTTGVIDQDLDMEEAWDITTGGLTANGDTIVVCVIDDGIDLTHDDITPNRWINHGEIPNNNIDDDNNGYVDDYLGWRSDTETDAIDYDGWHGTPVAGIIGAKGNNNLGVAGISWDVKLMIVTYGTNITESNVIAAYSYPYSMRKKYNETNGTQGAFVVATNASWGIDGADPDNYPLWCSFYDSLGTVGVLNCGATANANTNVDLFGDMPTACESDYLISVTNINSSGNKINQAGYGLTTIDLGAYGENTYTTAENNTYAGFGGTSGATPHVCGTIGLLYSVPCNSLATNAISNPAATALLVRDYILDGVEANTGLNGITVTGGQLNTNNSIQMAMDSCAEGGCFTPLSLTAYNITDSSATLSWFFNDSSTVILSYKQASEEAWTNIDITNANTFEWTDLNYCTNYDFRLRGICAEGDTTTYSNIYTFKTINCCELVDPTFNYGFSANNDISLVWSGIGAADSFTVYISINDAQTFVYNVQENQLTLENGLLDSCTTYEVQIIYHCFSGATLSSELYDLQTKGCGACLDFDYCESISENASNDEWIQNIAFPSLGIENESGNDDGYGDFTSIEEGFVSLEQGKTYSLDITAGFAGQLYTERVKAWIDYNQNGLFDNAEQLLLGTINSTSPLSTDITIPEGALLGKTRMRVILRYGNNTNFGGCANGYNFGETEDYCVNIIEPIDTVTHTTSIIEGENFNVYPNPASDNIQIDFDNHFGNQANVSLHSSNGALIFKKAYNKLSLGKNLLHLNLGKHPRGLYLLEVNFGDAVYYEKIILE